MSIAGKFLGLNNRVSEGFVALKLADAVAFAKTLNLNGDVTHVVCEGRRFLRIDEVRWLSKE